MALDFEVNTGYRSRAILAQPVRPKMLDLVLKTGVAKTEQGAANILITITLLIFGISLFVFLRTFRTPAPTKEMIESNERMMNHISPPPLQ